jgi:hypothetical protein
MGLSLPHAGQVLDSCQKNEYSAATTKPDTNLAQSDTAGIAMIPVVYALYAAIGGAGH